MYQRTASKQRLIWLVAMALVAPVGAVQFANVGAATPATWAEAWENGLGGWTVSGPGVSQDCNTGYSGCSLKMTPTPSRTANSASKSVNLPIGASGLVEFWFRGSSISGDTDTELYIDLNTGTRIVLHMTGGGNNRVQLSAGGGFSDVGTWTAANTWFRAAVSITSSSVNAAIYDGSGQLLGQSSALGIVPASTITKFTFYSIDWGSQPGTHHYDELTLNGGEPEPFQPVATVTQPSNFHASTNYVILGTEAEFEFDYSSTLHQCPGSEECPTSSEWRVLENGTAQDGTVADADLDGNLLSSGTFSQPAKGETVDHHVSTEAYLTGANGERIVKAAVRPIAGSAAHPWQVRTITVDLVNPLDSDADGVPDDLEDKLCERQIERDILDAMGGAAGSCPTPTNYVPPVDEISLTLPNRAEVGPDGDGDGFPSHATVFFTTVTYSPVNGLSLSNGGSSQLTLDPADDDANQPVPSNFCLPMPIPTGVASGPDADADTFPSYVRVTQGYLCADRLSPLNPISIFSASDLTQLTVDPNDNDANVPITATVTVSGIPTGITYRADKDDDTIPEGYDITYLSVTYDRTKPTQPPAQSLTKQFTALDPNDNDRNNPVPWTAIDADGDLIANAAEPWICLVEDQTDPIDGTCNGSNYNPPAAYQIVLDVFFGSF